VLGCDWPVGAPKREFRKTRLEICSAWSTRVASSCRRGRGSVDHIHHPACPRPIWTSTTIGRSYALFGQWNMPPNIKLGAGFGKYPAIALDEQVRELS
jgi:hypothetical protein